MLNKTVNLLALLRTAAILVFLGLFGSGQVFAQTVPAPERETLLNGLKILYWQQPGNPNVALKLRIHSGAAFDLADKAGMMALLSDALFPDPSTRDYVTEVLGGRLEVNTSFDAIEVTLTGKASELERMIDLLRGAVITTQLSADNVTALRNARIKMLSDKPPTAFEVANAAIAARLFGGFPYAHPVEGTVASVTKLERADLMLARERFLNADNASLAVIGGIQKARMMRALRQLLGPWAKSERSIPSTFRQSMAPDTRVLVIKHASDGNTEIRLAVRGLACSDNDSLAANLLAYIVRDRWRRLQALSSISVRHENHFLPGMFILSAAVNTENAARGVSEAQDVMRALATTGPTPTELEQARALLLADVSNQLAQPESVADAWLDVDTFNSPRPDMIATLVRGLSASDVQRVATRLFKDAPVATVVVGNYDQLKASFAGKMETSAELPKPKSTPPATLPLVKP